jgi:hypothetical protein
LGPLFFVGICSKLESAEFSDSSEEPEFSDSSEEPEFSDSSEELQC